MLKMSLLSSRLSLRPRSATAPLANSIWTEPPSLV